MLIKYTLYVTWGKSTLAINCHIAITVTTSDIREGHAVIIVHLPICSCSRLLQMLWTDFKQIFTADRS